MEIQIVIGNLVAQTDAEAVVNSANANLRLGSGVAGAIHTAAGPELERYCQQFAPLSLGKAVITPGFFLPNRYVIHARAAHYFNEDDAAIHLFNAYRSSLQLAIEHQISSIALPAIGVGTFKFPIKLAAEITMEALTLPEWKDTSIEWARICVTDSALKSAYEEALISHG